MAEVADPGESGAYLERPGLDRVRDLVEGTSGGVAVVWAHDADRITREPIHRAFLDDEFERFGTRLVALDDWGDNTHEGELLKYLKGWVSKGERLKIAERSRRGLLKKAKDGKVAGHPPPALRLSLQRFQRWLRSRRGADGRHKARVPHGLSRRDDSLRGPQMTPDGRNP